ncbi:Rpn family recombination-promoting nuclease/putative transposase [Thermicanus aegyptius]|uniref:Rpn family recombination-promoting nuclease/putative transposase n=1 Tax=Thermicanus aegyptius TaxID=94009 RepID=UPI00042A71F3|nr:Rpn family recombination-promoting nuclease/putative transposase [Thermicanus aegyptius]
MEEKQNQQYKQDNQGKTEYIHHDRLFKELIKIFFEDFILLFFPNFHPLISFDSVTFLSEEVYTDVVKGGERRVDLLVETKIKGVERLIIIHIEAQSYYQNDFHERMFIYYSRLYENHRRPILPIAVFSYDEKHDEPDAFTIEFPELQVLQFRYLTVELKKKNWRDYLRYDHPIAAALLSKMGYTKEERVEVKKEFLRMITRLQLDPARLNLITGFFDTYLHLNEEEERKLREEIGQLPQEESAAILNIMNSYEKKGYEQGIEKGIEQGKMEDARKMLLKGMDVNFIQEITELPLEKIEELKKSLERS